MKLAIAVALSHKAKLLVLDEATSGLDSMVREEILEIFNEFTRDETHSILLSSHIVSDLEKICDYIAFIHRGKLVFSEEKDRLLEENALVKMSMTDFEAIPEDAIRVSRKTSYGMESLVVREWIPDFVVTERSNLEDIILFLWPERRREDERFAYQGFLHIGKTVQTFFDFYWSLCPHARFEYECIFHNLCRYAPDNGIVL